MDPDVALAEIRSDLNYCASLVEQRVPRAVLDDAVMALRYKFADFDEWLKRGGFPPSEWRS